jgi:hypothetical protein
MVDLAVTRGVSALGEDRARTRYVTPVTIAPPMSPPMVASQTAWEPLAGGPTLGSPESGSQAPGATKEGP